MIYKSIYLFFYLFSLAIVSGKIYFKEDFNDAAWESRWTKSSDWKPKVRIIIKLFLFLLNFYVNKFL